MPSSADTRCCRNSNVTVRLLDFLCRTSGLGGERNLDSGRGSIIAGMGNGFDNVGGLAKASFLLSGGGQTGKRLYLALGTLTYDPAADAMRVGGLLGLSAPVSPLTEGEPFVSPITGGGVSRGDAEIVEGRSGRYLRPLSFPSSEPLKLSEVTERCLRSSILLEGLGDVLVLPDPSLFLT